MSVELSINFAGSKTGSVKIEKFRDELIPNLRRGMRNAGLLVERELKKSLQKGGGGLRREFFFRKSYDYRLHSQSGALRASINSQMGNEGGLPSVAIGPNVPYAAIHEFGGTIPVTEKMRRFLHWRGVHLKKSTTQIVIPKRPWFFPVVKKETPRIAETIQEAINKPLG